VLLAEGDAGIAEMQQAMVELARIGIGSIAPTILFLFAEGPPEGRAP